MPFVPMKYKTQEGRSVNMIDNALPSPVFHSLLSLRAAIRMEPLT